MRETWTDGLLYNVCGLSSPEGQGVRLPLFLPPVLPLWARGWRSVLAGFLLEPRPSLLPRRLGREWAFPRSRNRRFRNRSASRMAADLACHRLNHVKEDHFLFFFSG